MTKRVKVKLALIDSHALIHRGYHALPPMTAPDGTPTNAVFGFTSMVLKMFSVLKPTHVVAAFDVAGPTFRHKQYEDYKANRGETPDDLIVQFQGARDVLESFGIPIISKKGFEADDIIGTLVEQIDGGVQKIIVTGDMDALQLIDDDTTVFTLRRGVTDTVLYDEEMVREKYGFGPELVVDYKGLRGDPSDNIPGVAGVGEKTAKDLIAQFGDIEEIYKHLDEAPKRAQTRLAGKKDEALLSRQLATIKRDVKIDFTLADAELEGFDTNDVRKQFAEFGFKSLLDRLPKGGTAVQPSLFNGSGAKGDDVEMPDNYSLVESEADKKILLKALQGADVVAFDTETDGLGARDFPIVGVSFAFREKKKDSIQAYYVPVTQESVKYFQSFLEDESIGKTGHNLKYDYEVMMQSGIHVKGIQFDSMVAGYLLNPGSRQYSLDAMALSELDHHMIPITDLIGTGKVQKKVSDVPLRELARYAAEDADVSFQLYEKLAPRITEEGLARILEEIELPLIPVLSEIEMNGVAIDKEIFERLRVKVARKIAKLKKQIWDDAGSEFNINSTQQLRVVLFETLNLPTDGIKKTQTGFSTAASELEKLHGTHPIITRLESYRELTKLQNTYILTLPKLIDEKTGRIYASFNQVVAATGRLSSQDPNLQNIPVRTELGKEIRRAFVAEDGNVLVKADYSQVELRLAAHMSQDEKLVETFRAGEDIHRATAAWVFGIPLDEVTDKQRREAKTLNFGVLYGMGPQGFARGAGISVEEARSFIGRYRDQYKGLTRYIEEVLDFARQHEFVTTLLGRKRAMPEIHSSNSMISSQAERIAFNFPIQGTAADLLKKAMIDLQDMIDKSYPDVKMLLTVHDELVCEVAEKRANKFAEDMKRVMEGVITLDVPLIVDVGIGKNWQDVEAVN